jgi:phosphoserine phosphatase/predicted NAD-dependent protein-ADP-ribosyltransferase YbiA (DUF1768 family)
MNAALMCAGLAVLLGCSAATHSRGGFPSHWWAPIADADRKSWEIAPDAADQNSVILSKRNELGILSNFAATPFELDGVRYAGVEGFWQMMKYPEGPADPRAKLGSWPHTRAQVAQMVAFKAKRAGKLAGKILKPRGIRFVTYRGKRLDYKGADAPAHLALIRRAMEAKVAQNPRVRRVLLSTGTLTLKPDHRQSPKRTPAYEYHVIWMQIRARLRAEEAQRAQQSLSLWSAENRRRIVHATLSAGHLKAPVAVFDGDGTLWHADIPREFLTEAIRNRRLMHFDYAAAKTPEAAAARLYGTCRSDVSICIAQAAFLFAGVELSVLKTDMDAFFQGFESKLFGAQRQLTAYLRAHGYKIYLVSGGQQWLAAGAAGRFYQVPASQVVGVRTRIVDGRLSGEVVPPLPFRKGKAKAISQHIGRAPQIVVGNSRSDIPMLATATHLSIAVQSYGPQSKGFHYKSEQKLARHAKRLGWVVAILKWGNAAR